MTTSASPRTTSGAGATLTIRSGAQVVTAPLPASTDQTAAGEADGRTLRDRWSSQDGFVAAVLLRSRAHDRMSVCS